MNPKLRRIPILAALALAERTDRRGSVSAVLAAAGSATRFGTPKAFVEIDGRFLFEYSLEALLSSQYVGEVILAVRREDEERVKNVLDLRFKNRPVHVCIGGKERAESVLNAFLKTAKESRFVAFHDAARPLITTEEIDRVIVDAFHHGAATAASPVVDSLKRVKDGKIVSDVDRDQLYAVSTPQVFLRDLYEVARAICREDGFDATDDNAYATHAGFTVHVTKVSNNQKLTYPEDLEPIILQLSKQKGGRA